MERLTNKREADAQREEYERRLANGYPRNIPEERFLRLAAYEDTGLTPEEVKELMHDTTGPLHRRFVMWMDANGDGRLLVLPCKVGDTVYRVFCGNMKNPVISEFKIGNVHDAVTLIGKMGMHKYTGVFRTREEAERALEEKRNGTL